MSNEIIKKEGVLPQGFTPFPKIDLTSPSSDLANMKNSIKSSLPGKQMSTAQKGLLNLKSMNPMGMATGILDGIAGDSSSKMDPTSAMAKSAIKGALNFVPGGQIVNLADSALGVVNKIAGVDPLSGLSTGDKILSSIPVLGQVGAMFGSKLEKKNFDRSSVASDFSFGKEADAAALGGKSALFGKRAFKDQIADAWNLYNRKANITDYNKKRLNNDIKDQLQQRTLDTMSGSGQEYRLVKNGGKLYSNSQLDSFLKILDEISTKRSLESNKIESTPKKFQLGGKMNLIPEGALHARKHDLTSIDPNLKGQITTKGIPVISESEGGVIQHAEIEKEEWTLRKEFTDQLEALYKQYQDNPSDELAIEAGRLVCYELLKNTDDRSGLIKSIK